MQPELYRHSGRFNPQFLAAVPVGLLTAFVGAFLYAAAEIYSPIVGITSLLAVGAYAGAVGFVVGWVLKKTHTRSTPAALAAGALVGLFTIWFAWVAFLYVFLLEADAAPSLLDLYLNPGLVAEIAGVINENGWFTVKSATPSGMALSILWAGEAALLFGLPAWMAVHMTDEPYCEACGQWMAFQKGYARVQPDQDIAGSLSAFDAGGAGKVPDVAPTAAAYERLDLSSCQGCTNTRALSVVKVTVSVDRKGNRSEAEKFLLKRMLVDEAFLQGFSSARARRVAT